MNDGYVMGKIEIEVKEGSWENWPADVQLKLKQWYFKSEYNRRDVCRVCLETFFTLEKIENVKLAPGPTMFPSAIRICDECLRKEKRCQN